MVAVALGLAAAACWGTADFFVAVVARRVGTLKTVVGVQLASVPLYIALFIGTSARVEMSPAAIAGLAAQAVLILLIFAAFYRALQLGPVAIVTPVVAAYAAVVIVLARLFLGESMNTLQISGAWLTIGGAVLASADLRQLGSRSVKITAGVWLALVSLFGFGVSSFISGAYAREFGWLVPSVVMKAMLVVMISGIATARGAWPGRGAGGKTLALMAGCGMLEATGVFAFTRASEMGFVAVGAAASAAYPLIPLVLGLTVFKERLAPNQWAGVAGVLVGVGLLSVGGAS